MYGSASRQGALSEVIFRDLAPPGVGPRSTARTTLDGAAMWTLQPRRDLQLGRLLGDGPAHIGTSEANLCQGPNSTYPVTAEWAKAIHWGTWDIDGLLWISRQDRVTETLLIWQDRALDVLAPLVGPEPIDSGPGLREVEQMA